jgi:Chlorite dismutase
MPLSSNPLDLPFRRSAASYLRGGCNFLGQSIEGLYIGKNRINNVMEGDGPKGASSGQLIGFRANDVGGQWRTDSIVTVTGPTLKNAAFLQIGVQPPAAPSVWTLTAFVSNLRYTTSSERQAMREQQEGLGRRASTCAVLIPIRKTEAWWSLAQDERRAIYERSNHTPIGLDYLPAIARQLHHCRDLGEPFDFLTWFEFAAKETSNFKELLARLRDTEEWSYVDREVEVWLTRNS